MANNQVIAFWGSPGSGTTVTSIKISKELARKRKNVILVLTDQETPLVPLLLPSVQGKKSLGDLMAIPKISPIDIFQHCVSIGTTISLLGYLYGENEMTWPEYDEAKAFELLRLMRVISDYTVIDCSHHLLTDVLTCVALQEADCVIRVTNADPKSLSYIKSQQPFLKDPKFRYGQQLCVINNVYPYQDAKGYEDVFGAPTTFSLPHIPSLQMQFSEGRLMDSLSGREGRLYEPLIRAIVAKEIIDRQQNSNSSDRKEDIPHAEPC